MTWAPDFLLGHYRLIESIGAGGMGEVWKARDTRLNRTVAIKHINPEHADRFKREAHAIAALNHPHICQIYDVGSDYMVMEYIEGKPLQGPLPVLEAVRLAMQIADALAEAHRKGIIHRDLKPANVLVTANGAKLLDFGLAKMESRATDDSTISLALTSPGFILGTLSYMSPEQAQGQEIDARSDVFAFGSVLYEMLSGQRAFRRDTPIATITAVVNDEPTPLDAPLVLDRIVRRCLAKRPSDRFQSMTEVRAALEQVGLKPAEQRPSIAVLPFADMSAEKDNEYFSDGLAEEIINALTQLPGLRVIARTSAFRFRAEQDLRKIASALHVETILEGSVRKAGNRLRITVQLIHAGEESPIWSERYDRDMADIFAVQEEIARSVAGKFKIRMHGPDSAPVRLRHHPTVDAFHAYLKGRYWGIKLSPEAVARSFEFHKTAIALDPAYDMPHIGLAFNHLALASTGTAPAFVHAPRAKAELQKALEINPDVADARLMLGLIRGAFEHDWKGAEEETRQALASGPVGPDALLSYARLFLWPTKRFEEAWNAVEKAHELDPLSAIVMYIHGEVLTVQGRFEEALPYFRQAVELDPEFWVAPFLIALCDLHLGRTEKFADSLQAVVRLQPGHVMTQRLKAVYATLTGRPEEARSLQDDLVEHRAQRYCSWYHIGEISRCLGDLDETYRYWNLAVDEGDPLALWIPSGMYPQLRGDPRHATLLARMNLS